MAKQTLFESAMVILRAAAGNSSEPGRFPLHWLSDLDSGQAAGMARLWRTLPLAVRRDLLGRMEAEARDNFELDFLAIARIALNDEDPETRVHAIRSFWECGDTKLVDRFLGFLEQDPEAAVRAAAASALGLFVERAELGKISATFGRRIVERLIAAVRGRDDLEVRCRAVESLGFSSDPQMRAILENAHTHPEERMRASALLAMGRSADPVWGRVVLEEMRSSLPVLRAEAARAAGSLGLRNAVPPLIELMEDVDSGVHAAAVGALGEIGGGKAREALEKALRQAVGEEWDRIEMALENAEFQDSLGDLPLLDLAGEDEEDEDEFVEE
jgi:Arc/MetJ family transcription regulator